MSKKQHLTTEQYKMLRGLSLNQKIDLILDWYIKGEITKEQQLFFCDLWVNRETKKRVETLQIRKKSNDNDGYRTIAEGKVQQFIQMLQTNLKDYITYRDKEAVKLEAKALSTMLSYFNNYPWMAKINELLILALRYPDQKVNELAVNYIRKHKMQDTTFWLLLWADNNLVPMDAVRLMTVVDDGKIKINPSFSQYFIKLLRPLFQIQRDKEALRVSSALSESLLERRKKRLKKFDDLIAAAKEYVKS